MTMSKFNWAGFLMSFLVFVSRDFELGRTWLAGGVDRQSRTGLILSKQYCRLIFYSCCAHFVYAFVSVCVDDDGDWCY